MGLDNALYKFKLLTGLDDSQAEEWIPVIKDSLMYIRTVVDFEALSEEQAASAEKSAGVYAFYQYAGSAANRESSFTAGDLRVEYNDNLLGYADSLWKAELDRLTALSGGKSSAFLFKRV